MQKYIAIILSSLGILIMGFSAYAVDNRAPSKKMEEYCQKHGGKYFKLVSYDEPEYYCLKVISVKPKR